VGDGPAMTRRLISATLLGLTLTVVQASAALAHEGSMLGEDIFSGDSVLLALITSFLTGLICYTLMVWEPKGVRKQAAVRSRRTKLREGE